MKKLLSSLFLSFAFFTLFIVSCNKSDDIPIFDEAAQYKADSIALKNYASSKFPNAKYDSNTGIWYEILHEGTGNYTYKIVDTLNAKYLKFFATVNYSGKLLNGNVFDQTATDKPATFEIRSNTSYKYPFVSTLIPGWIFAFAPNNIGELKLDGLTQKGLQKESKIHIMIPSRWGYGNQAVGSIPANSPLDFVIEVVDIK